MSDCLKCGVELPDYCAVCDPPAIVERLTAENAALRTDLEAVNAFARTLGYGQGELDGDLAGCIAKSFDALRAEVAEFKSANQKWVEWSNTAVKRFWW